MPIADSVLSDRTAPKIAVLSDYGKWVRSQKLAGRDITWDWTFRKSGLVVARRKNVQTTYGLTAFASGYAQAYSYPAFLALEQTHATVNATIAAGASSIVLTSQVHLAGDTQIVVSPNTANVETLTFTSVTGTGPYTYNLSGTTTKTHTAGDRALRAVKAADITSGLQTEGQFDSVNSPSKRLGVTNGYSPGTGQYTVGWYYTAGQAKFYIGNIGLMDSDTVGAGNLHNHCLYDYDNSAGTTDLEIDATVTLS